MFLRPPLICFECPSSVRFSDLDKKRVASFILIICQNQNQNINSFIDKMNKKAGKKGASLVFDEIIKKSGLICFGEFKIKMITCLSHLFFKKVA